MTGQTDYSLLYAQLEALTEGETDTIANLANAAAALYMNLPDINWAGFYLMRWFWGPFRAGLPVGGFLWERGSAEPRLRKGIRCW